jgi:hypothetical protein
LVPANQTRTSADAIASAHRGDRDLDFAHARAESTLDLARTLDLGTLDLARTLEFARALNRTLQFLENRNRADLEKRSGSYEGNVLLFLSRYAFWTSVSGFLVLRPLLKGSLSSFLWPLSTQKRGDQKPQELAKAYFEVATVTMIDGLRRSGEIPILGGIRVIREPTSQS